MHRGSKASNEKYLAPTLVVNPYIETQSPPYLLTWTLRGRHAFRSDTEQIRSPQEHINIRILHCGSQGTGDSRNHCYVSVSQGQNSLYWKDIAIMWVLQ